MNVTAFKSHALEIISRISEKQESLVITKRGKAMVEVIPYRLHKNKIQPGQLASALVSAKDIVSPWEKSLWEADQ